MKRRSMRRRSMNLCSVKCPLFHETAFYETPGTRWVFQTEHILLLGTFSKPLPRLAYRTTGARYPTGTRLKACFKGPCTVQYAEHGNGVLKVPTIFLYITVWWYACVLYWIIPDAAYVALLPRGGSRPVHRVAFDYVTSRCYSKLPRHPLY